MVSGCICHVCTCVGVHVECVRGSVPQWAQRLGVSVCDRIPANFSCTLSLYCHSQPLYPLSLTLSLTPPLSLSLSLSFTLSVSLPSLSPSPSLSLSQTPLSLSHALISLSRFLSISALSKTSLFSSLILFFFFPFYYFQKIFYTNVFLSSPFWP